MATPKIAIGLSPQNYAGLVNLGNRVIVSVTGNGNFGTPAVPLPTLQAAVTAVENAYAKWAPLGSYGSKADLLDLRQKSSVLSQFLKAEAQYVQITAQLLAGGNDEMMAAIIGTSGYELAKPRTPQGVLQMVQNLHRFVSRTLTVNQLKLKWEKPLDARRGNVNDYRIMRSATPDFATAVEIGSTTKTSFIDVNDSNTLQTWTYWIVAFNSYGPGVPSDPITVTILNA
jgi:hypothetical protein